MQGNSFKRSDKRPERRGIGKMRLIDIFRTYSASVDCASIKVENKLKPV